jgi:hypothetical protein
MSDDDDLDFAQLAADQELAKAIAAGAEILYDDTAPVPEIPPPGAPITVVRTVRLPFDVDTAVQQLADQQGTTPSALIRGWVVAALESATTDTAEELRTIQAAAQRALEPLASDRLRHAA